MPFRLPMPFFVAALVAVAGAALAAQAAEAPPQPPTSNATYGRHLLDLIVRTHPEIASITLTAVVPKGTVPVIFASTTERPGDPATADDVAALRGGDPLLSDAGAGRTTVIEPLLDVSGLPIGAIRLTVNGAPDAARAAAADAQGTLGLHVLSPANLLDAFPYSSYSPNNPAQALTDATIARHPELIVLGMHVNLPDGSGNVMLGANIGRIGKKADEDDLRVITQGTSNFEVADNHRRYEVELPLNDAAGRRIGALGEVFRYRDGDDKAILNALAIRIRDELARSIPSNATLAATDTSAALRLLRETAIPGYKGDFDHFAVDVLRNRLYLAGEDGGALEVLNLKTGALLRSIPGYGVPHSLVLLPDRAELLVVDGAQPSRVLDAATLALKRRLALPAGADSIDFDASTGHVWIVTGGKDVLNKPDNRLIEVDPHSGAIVRSVHFAATHVEALAVEQHGDRMYVNVADRNTLAVVNKRTGALVSMWPVKEAKQNSAIAIDETHKRIFDVARGPGMLIVIDAASGKTIASFPAPERADQVVWDAVNRRIYVPGGEGTIGVYEQIDGDHYRALPRLTSRYGAKTAILVPSQRALYVAASPGDTAAGGAVLRYDILPRR